MSQRGEFGELDHQSTTTGVALAPSEAEAVDIAGAPGATGDDPVVLHHGSVVRIPVIGRLVPLMRLQMGLGLILLNIADVALTKAILHNGAIEANPLMAPMMSGTAAPFGTKTVIPAVAALLLVMCPVESRLANRAVATVLGLYVAIVAWNCAVLVHLVV